MAKLQFIRGAITGRLGEFVGSKWKGINYIRLHTDPANPRTPDQVSIREVFKKVSFWATALYSLGWLELIPAVRRMTERNSVFRANKDMFTNKVFRGGDLQVYGKPNLDAIITNLTCVYNSTARTYACGARIAFPDSTNPTGKVAHIIIYDHLKGVVQDYRNTPIVIPPAGYMNISDELTPPINFNTPGNSLTSDTRMFVFISGTENDKPLISKTLSCALV